MLFLSPSNISAPDVITFTLDSIQYIADAGTHMLSITRDTERREISLFQMNFWIPNGIILYTVL